MKQSLIVSFFFALFFTYEANAQRYTEPIFERRPFWKESFSKRGPVDSNKWSYFTDYSSIYKNCVFTDDIENTFVKNGKLHLVATRDPENRKTSATGRIRTLGKQSFLYGKLEVKAKIPTGHGLCPAIWMLREDHPRTVPLGEIDIMEYIECFEKKQYVSTIHIVEKEPGQKEVRHKHSARIDADMDNKYHIYSLEWTPESLVLKLDGQLVYSLVKDEAEFWPFDDPYYLILGLTYGNWGASCGMDESILPCEMLVDWVRYYRLKQSKQ